VTLVKEISIREDTSMMQVLEDPHLKKVLMDENLDKNQKAHKVRIYLKQKRFPSIAAAERSYEKYRQRLKLGEHIKLIPPTNFESPTYTIRITFNTMTELKDLETVFNSLIDNPFLKKIIG
jgi:hypothetical protein